MSGYPMRDTIRLIMLNAMVVERIANAMLKKYRLSAQGFKILNVIAEQGTPIAPSAMQKLLGVSAQSVSQRLDNLEKNGYIQRQRTGADRRRTLVSLTAEGRRVFDKSWNEGEAMRTFMEEKISAAESETLLSLLDKHHRLYADFEKNIKR